MLSLKLTRITLKMADFEEYDRLKRERERKMDTSPPQDAVDGSSCSRTEKWQPKATPTAAVTGGGGGGGIEGRRPVRASTPDSPTS